MSTLIVKCPTCKKDIAWDEVPTRPFCSERCRLIDLGDWADEKFAVPDEHSQPSEQDIDSKKEDDSED